MMFDLKPLKHEETKYKNIRLYNIKEEITMLNSGGP